MRSVKWRRKLIHLGMVFILICTTTLLITCGGGGGSSNSPSQSDSKGTASGTLIIPPNNTVEIEPNDDVSQAQSVSGISSISGSVAEKDNGFIIPGPISLKVADYYRLTASGPLRMTLNIAADDLTENDLDLVLMDLSGKILDISVGFVSTELIETSSGGDFLIGVVAFQGNSNYVLNFANLGRLAGVPNVLPLEAEFVPGEIVVKLKRRQPGNPRKLGDLALRHGLTHKQSFPPGVELMRISVKEPAAQKNKPGPPLKLNLPKSRENALKAITLDAIKKLQKDPDVAYAEANFIRQPSLVPDDPHYKFQWHYPLIHLPQAWEMTTGSNDVIVAVIDTGILLNHPDLSGRLIAGYDFISNLAMANDGGGIDADPDDPGDDPKGIRSSFHGTHVAGTIGAATNNTSGVAGVTWQTRIMPLRVLGVGGGIDTDITQAIQYAAGLPNSSGTLPTERAHIINLSLGGPDFSQTLQDAIEAARAQGLMVVAAAGNQNVSTVDFPAGLDGVISVSAVDIRGIKAPYSNFGSKIDVAGPGGRASLNLNNDHLPDGVLSTMGSDAGNFDFLVYEGTSMASPHVAGVLALMLAVNPTLTPTDIDQLLAGSHPDTPIRITQDIGATGRDDVYGHGLIDASQAVIAARKIPGGTGSIPTGSILNVSTTSLNFSNFINVLPVNITNAGVETLNIISVTDDAPWLTVTSASGTAPLALRTIVNRSGLPSGEHNATITITSDAGQGSQTATISAKISAGGITRGDVGSVVIQVRDEETFTVVVELETTSLQDYAFTTPPIPPGNYIVIAGTDRDNDGFICDFEDACGFFQDLLSISAGQNTPDVHFIVGGISSPQGTNQNASPLQRRPFKRLD